MGIDKIKDRRSFYELMSKRAKDGLLDKSTINRLKGIGFDVAPVSEVHAPVVNFNASGQMSIDKSAYREYSGMHSYNSDSWKPDSLVFHDDNFWEWINSITFGFVPDKTFYRKFELYKAQAQYYYDNAKDPYSEPNIELRRDIILEEYAKIDNNTLYFSMKYGWVKEGSNRSGKIRYVPKEHNAIILYLLDCGYPLLFGKPRQIFATTTVGLFIIKKIITQENFYMKLITEDENTGFEILSDKVKVAFTYLPSFLKPTVARDYISGFRVGKKDVKGGYSLPNSRIEVVAPKKTAINGGSPQIVLIDEVGNVPDLIPMILEARPTMFIDKNQDGDLQLVRQIISWGTGVSDNKGKNAFQSLWTNTLDFWESKQFKSAMFVPLFFSWHSRCSKDVYESEKKSYYSGDKKDLDGLSTDEQKAIFHMHYPSVWRDMFSMATSKLVPRSIIDDNLARIRSLPISRQPIPGKFEPIYDLQSPYGDGVGVPYKIIGAKFVPHDDYNGEKSDISVWLYDRPNKDWKNRYYQGTDPVVTETGTSLFASVIWDAVDNRPACIMNYRKSYDHRAAFIQSLLMSLYYDVDNSNRVGVPELIENNIGINYLDFKELMGYANNIIFNGELPNDLRGGGANWGLNTKAARKQILVSKLSECVTSYANNFMHDVIFRQLDTYVPIVKSSGISYEPVDKRLYKDDVLDALAFAYVARLSFSHINPVNISENKETKIAVSKPKLIRLPDGTLDVIYKRV